MSTSTLHDQIGRYLEEIQKNASKQQEINVLSKSISTALSTAVKQQKPIEIEKPVIVEGKEVAAATVAQTMELAKLFKALIEAINHAAETLKVTPEEPPPAEIKIVPTRDKRGLIESINFTVTRR